MFTKRRPTANSVKKNGQDTSMRETLSFFPNGPPYSAIVDILKPLSWTEGGIQSDVATSYRYSKLNWISLTVKTSATHVVMIFYDYWILSCGIFQLLLSNIGRQSVVKSVERLCCNFRIEHLATTAYRP